MDTVNTSIASLKTIVDDYAVKANSVKAGLNSFKTTLEANLNSMTNLTSGSFNGMNCRAIGESIWDLRDSFCIGLVESINYNIICLSIICYGVLLLACFVTCTGVRHFKHLQKMQMHVGYKGTPISLSDTRILDKWFLICLLFSHILYNDNIIISKLKSYLPTMFLISANFRKSSIFFHPFSSNFLFPLPRFW